MLKKPDVFNYRRFVEAMEENRQLRDKVANLEIRCRILEESTTGQPGGDLISRQAALDILYDFAGEIVDTPGGHYNKAYKEYRKRMESLPSAEPVQPHQVDCTDFIRWIRNEVMDEENWELNAVAKGEVICRKLEKLGAVFTDGGYYRSEEPVYRLMAQINFDGEEIKESMLKTIREEYQIKEPVHGEWVFKTNIPIGNGASSAGYVCSVCGCDVFRTEGMNYCPNCGAKMGGNDRACGRCKHHTDGGCSSWDCEFEERSKDGK